MGNNSLIAQVVEALQQNHSQHCQKGRLFKLHVQKIQAAGIATVIGIEICTFLRTCHTVYLNGEIYPELTVVLRKDEHGFVRASPRVGTVIAVRKVHCRILDGYAVRRIPKADVTVGVRIQEYRICSVLDSTGIIPRKGTVHLCTTVGLHPEIQQANMFVITVRISKPAAGFVEERYTDDRAEHGERNEHPATGNINVTRSRHFTILRKVDAVRGCEFLDAGKMNVTSPTRRWPGR